MREPLQRVGGQRYCPGVQGQRCGSKPGPLGVGAALVIARGRRVDQRVVEHDAVALLVLLALTELLNERVSLGRVVAEDPQRVPAVFARAGGLANHNRADLAGNRSVAAGIGQPSKGLSQVNHFGRSADEGSRFLPTLPERSGELLPGLEIRGPTRGARQSNLIGMIDQREQLVGVLGGAGVHQNTQLRATQLGTELGE